MTPVGTTPLDQHAMGKDPLVRAALVFDANGARVGPANGVIADGQVAFASVGSEAWSARLLPERAAASASAADRAEPCGRSLVAPVGRPLVIVIIVPLV